MHNHSTRTGFTLLLTLALLLVAIIPVAAKPAGTVNVQLLAVNDFHGNLEPPAGSSGRIGATNAGGAEYLSTHLKNLEATNPNTLIVSAGDAVGASPLLSALFHDEPTIEAFNLMGFDYTGLGNHEFDEGWAEIQRLQEGGCHPVDGCLDGDPFYGAVYRFLSGNVYFAKNNKTIFPPYKIVSVAGAKIAFIGITLEGTPTIVTPSGVDGLIFQDEIEAVNGLVPQIKKQGVSAIVILLHEGGAQSVGLSESSINTCTGFTGPVVDIANGVDDEVDVILSAHTHNAYNCTIDGKLVTSAASFGRLITDVDLTLDRATGNVVSKTANNVIVTRDVAKDPAITALIAKYQAVAGPIANRIIGSITADLTRSTNAAGESVLGDVIADAQLYATTPVGFGEAVAAFMNPGGIRAELIYASSTAGEGDGNVTYGESFAVQPFGNSLVTMTLTGDQIDQVLEQQFDNPSVGTVRILQVSTGFTYEWSVLAPTGSKVSNIMINGVPLDPAASYRITVNSFLAEGGDNFTALRQGTNRLGGAVDTDALSDYFAAFSPIAPTAQDRIVQVP